MSDEIPNPNKTTSRLSPAGGPSLEEPQGLVATITTKLAGMRFWTFSALIHAVLILFIGGTVLIQHHEDPPDFAGEGEFVSSDTQQSAPPPPAVQMSNTQPTPNTTTVAVSPTELSAIVTTAPTQVTLNASITAAPSPKVDLKPSSVSAPAVNNAGLTKSMAAGIAGFSSGWSKAGGRGGNLKERSFEFTAYLAKYSGGDWDSTVRMDGDKIAQGSLPNLLFVMKKLSRDKVSGNPQVKPLDLASEEIFEKKPPFIFFTGHRDFKLTDKEVANLRGYILVGGCIWGDSSLPGHRSRFDIAFRREMKRVIADVNKDWKELPANHPIFTKCYFPEIKTPPPGLNFYSEPVYALQGVGGEIGVIYTANDYGDMFQFGIDEHGNIDTSRDENHKFVAVDLRMWYHRNLYFHNIEPKALLDSYKFGMNIVIHLMTRWEEKIGMQSRM